MAKRDLKNNLKVTQLLDPDTVTSDTATAAVDMQGYDSLMLVVAVGASGDTLSGSLYTELEVQHSDSPSSGFAACADADILDAITGNNTGTFAKIDDAAEDDAAYKVSYIGNKRYVKVNINVSGTHSNGTPIGVVAIQGHGHALPVS